MNATSLSSDPPAGPAGRDAGHGGTVDSSEAVLLAGLVLLAIALRLPLLEVFPPPVADEGGWPLSVRRFVESGVLSADFHSAPGYHLALGAAFALFGSTLEVARYASVAVSVAGLVFFIRFAQLALEDRRAVLWATALMAVAYPVVLAQRRALIEPYQITWLLALAFVFQRGGARAALWIGVCAAGALLTKANAIFIVPALAAAALQEGRRVKTRIGGLAAGTAAAAAVFGLLYLADPAAFAEGWSDNLALPDMDLSPALVRVGRFGLSPEATLESLEGLTTAAPFLTVLGVVGTVRGMATGRQAAAAWWTAAGGVFLLIQVWQPENYFAVLYPPACLLTVWTVAQLEAVDAWGREEEPPGKRHPGGLPARSGWGAVFLSLVVVYSLLRVAGAAATVRSPEQPSVDWLAHRAGPDDVVVAAPYVLMQLESPGVSPFRFRPTLVPTPSRLQEVGADYVLMDDREWRSKLERSPAAGDDELEAALGRCCVPVHRSEGGTVYRVRPRPAGPAPGDAGPDDAG